MGRDPMEVCAPRVVAKAKPEAKASLNKIPVLKSRPIPP